MLYQNNILQAFFSSNNNEEILNITWHGLEYNA